ncbi:GPR1/FUN34/YaaH family transporter [Isoptericola sp. 178]|uniref:GPR1/FUN34/YaaH family transporter n=1 Tax=Isoptericola sp. 178 TaxID=3064651 RepID=UPI002712FCFA|nr:GPR1/FUN34/YaaH family transporter [Isoptericola sp. 178]MDO8145925.1 GPR1/FUN34/YaaH family transporter [Isoptericola sp. 178]
MNDTDDGQRTRSEQLEITRIVLRPTGNPLPLGFMALAVATVGFSCLQLGILSTAEESTVALAVLVLTVPLQLLAAIIGFGARDPIAGTGMAVVSGVWAMLAVSTLTSPPGSSSPALGVLLLTAALAMVVPALAAGGKVVAAAVMIGSGVRFAVTGVAEFTGSGAWETTAGVLGLVLAAMALYAALGFVLEEVDHPVRLPVLRRGAGLKPLRDDLEEQLEGVARSAGVRQQL